MALPKQADERPVAVADSPGREAWRVLAVALTAIVMAIFDLFVVNVATPQIRSHLHAGDASIELVISGYAFTYATGLITGARLGDRFGYRRIFVSGMAAFTVTSLLCGLARTPAELVVARLAQGLSAAAMVPQVMSLITVTFPAEHRGRATAWYGVAGGLAALAGQIFGGLLIDWNPWGAGWRSIFMVNVPVGAAAALAAARLLPSVKGPEARFDPWGAAGVTAVSALLLLPLAFGRQAGWPAWTWICLALTGPAAVLTIRVERRVARRGGAPVLNGALLRNRGYTVLLAACSLFQAYFGSFMFTLSILLQGALGFSPDKAAMVFFCQGLLYTATSLRGGTLVTKYGRRVPIVGTLLVMIGLGGLSLALVDGPPSDAQLIAALAVIGAGNGLILPPLLGAALRTVDPANAGAASGLLNTAQQLANSLGVTVIGSVFFAAAGGTLRHADGAMQVATCIYLALSAAVAVAAATGWPTNASERR